MCKCVLLTMTKRCNIDVFDSCQHKPEEKRREIILVCVETLVLTCAIL